MKKLIVLFSCLLTFGCQAQTGKVPFDGPAWQAPYHLSMDSWSIERFPIPIEFAPAIKYTGVEDIRFFKGWSNANSTEYWSYAFLWYLDGTVKTDAAGIEKNLNSYYDGLIGRNIEKRNIPAEKVFKTKASIKQIKTEKGDLQTYAGVINMLDYMAQKPIALNCFVHIRKCADKPNTIIFYQLSPQETDSEIWKSLKQLWADFKCEK